MFQNSGTKNFKHRNCIMALAEIISIPFAKIKKGTSGLALTVEVWEDMTEKMLCFLKPLKGLPIIM